MQGETEPGSWPGMGSAEWETMCKYQKVREPVPEETGPELLRLRYLQREMHLKGLENECSHMFPNGGQIGQ